MTKLFSNILTNQQLTGRDESHLVWLDESTGIHQQALPAWKAMSEEAKLAGFDLKIASGYRGFDRQLSIWNRKFSGQLHIKGQKGEILDNNKNIRYNSKGELLTIEDRVNEFLDANPHFRKGSLSGTGSQSSIEGKTVKPFNIQDLDMGKAEDRKKYAEYRKQRDSSPVQINLNNNKHLS